MKENQNTNAPKQIVYILGAGSTQAEASYKGGDPVNLSMKDNEKLGGDGISTRILKRAKTDESLDIRNEEVDIEKLISLLAVTGTEETRKKAEDLRTAYFEEIVESLAKVAVLNKPELAIGLLEMHKNELFNKEAEYLSGIITLNHDNLFQVASQEVYEGINLGFDFLSVDFKDNKKAPLIIQLHGSFNWINALPIEVLKLDTRKTVSEKILWIPPTILKESKDYPYNKLTALAYELLSNKCNILRIIGCSLSQNDWNLISLIFNAQYKQYLKNRNSFKIELIMDHDEGEKVKKEYSYLKNITPIGHLVDGDFSDYLVIPEERPEHSALDNPFEVWLKRKVEFHIRNNKFHEASIGKTLKKIIGS